MRRARATEPSPRSGRPSPEGWPLGFRGPVPGRSSRRHRPLEPRRGSMSAPRAARWIVPIALVVVWLAIGGSLGPYAGQARRGRHQRAGLVPAAAAPSRPGARTAVGLPARPHDPRDRGVEVREDGSDPPGSGRRPAAPRLARGAPASRAGLADHPAQDGKAMQGVVQLEPDRRGGDPGRRRPRPRRGRPGPGDDAPRGGPAATQADLSDAFAGIDDHPPARRARGGAADPAAGLPQRAAAAA